MLQERFRVTLSALPRLLFFYLIIMSRGIARACLWLCATYFIWYGISLSGFPFIHNIAFVLSGFWLFRIAMNQSASHFELRAVLVLYAISLLLFSAYRLFSCL